MQHKLHTSSLLLSSATGCAEPKIPKHAWMRREGEAMVVRCNRTHEQWNLVCKETEWVGEVGNCSGEQAGKDQLRE